MSELYIKKIALIVLLGSTILLGLVFPFLNQATVIAFSWVFYGIIWLSKHFFGQSFGTISRTEVDKLGKKKVRGLEEIALREYEYIQETMEQAMNDRHTMVNYFLLATGVAIAAIGVVYSEEGMIKSPYKNEITTAICITFALVGWIYLLKIVRLRQAWCESSVAMNRIKNFFLQHSGIDDQHPGSPFLWKSTTISRSDKRGNLWHLEFVLSSFIASISIASVSLVTIPSYHLRENSWVAALIFFHHFFLQLSTYELFLGDKRI